MDFRQQKVFSDRLLLGVIALVIIAALCTMIFAPEATKPLFLKYYRSLYSAELTRSL